MPTYPLPTLAPTVDATGISAPSFADILESLKASYRSIYGSDVNLDPDSQDGQWLAVAASAVNDTNAASIAIYNSFSPATSQGGALSSNVKINGISRRVPTNSTVDVTIVGQAGTVIINGAVSDTLGTKWNLGPSVTIPLSGTITVTATASVAGEIPALPGTVNRIATPTRGWQSVTNTLAAAPGAPVEDDAQLRQRQSRSASLPALSSLDGVYAAVANVAGVSRMSLFENPTGTTDANGIPAHSISVVAVGGSSADIAAAIALKKTPGTGTFGNTTVLVPDSKGLLNTIKFNRAVPVPIAGQIGLNKLAGFSYSTIGLIQQALADAINQLPIGAVVTQSKLYSAANLDGNPLGATYDIRTLLIGRDGITPTNNNIILAYNEVPTASPGSFTVIAS